MGGKLFLSTPLEHVELFVGSCLDTNNTNETEKVLETIKANLYFLHVWTIEYHLSHFVFERLRHNSFFVAKSWASRRETLLGYAILNGNNEQQVDKRWTLEKITWLLLHNNSCTTKIPFLDIQVEFFATCLYSTRSNPKLVLCS